MNHTSCSKKFIDIDWTSKLARKNLLLLIDNQMGQMIIGYKCLKIGFDKSLLIYIDWKLTIATITNFKLIEKQNWQLIIDWYWLKFNLLLS